MNGRLFMSAKLSEAKMSAENYYDDGTYMIDASSIQVEYTGYKVSG